MKKILFLVFRSVILLLILFPIKMYGADTKISDLPADTTPGTDSLVATVDAPGSSPATRKTTIGELFSAATDLDANGVISADSVALTTDTTGNYAAGDAEAGAATSGDNATAFFGAGTIEHERGGLEADVNAYGGLVGINGGSTIDINTSAEVATALSDETGTGKVVFGTSPTINTPVVSNGMDINLAADDNITIDARTNPRTVTLGAMRWNHTPDASTPNTRALFLDVDANSVPNTQGMHIHLKATSIAAGETITGVQILGDTSNSTGGTIRLIELDKVGVGDAEVHALHIDPEVSEVIHHSSGAFIDPTQGWSENGGFTDTTTAFGSSGTDVSIFAADNDAIYIGAETVFQEVEVILNTPASNPGIKPTFEIWTGASWTTITPTDGTAGFREDGIIDLGGVDTSSWAANSVNSVTKFYLQITRTQNSLGVNPIEDLIQTANVKDFIWDGDGNLTINTIIFEGATDDANETTITPTDPTADRTITIPDETGTVCTTGSVCTGYQAAVTDGRSLTFAGATLDADPELYTDQSGYKDLTPEVGTLDNMFWFMNAVTVTYVSCITDAGTVTLNLEDGGDNDILSSDIVCDADGQTACAAGCDVDTINTDYDNITAKTEWIAVDTSAESGAADFTLYVGYTIDD